MIIRTKAPLRISFAGGGTDVPPFPEREGGCVLNATINNYAWGSLRPRTDDQIRVESLDIGVSLSCTVESDMAFDGQLDLVKGAIRRLGALNSHGFEMFLHSDAPPGSGLGSSSALMVALVGLVKEFRNLSLNEYEIAALAYEIERNDLGIPGGLQDHYAAAFGGFNFIEFTKDHVVVNPLRISQQVVNELEHNLLLCFTGTTRQSNHIIEDQTRRYEHDEERTVQALRHQKELAVEMKNALLHVRLNDFGDLLHSAWESKKKFSPKISSSSIDEMYQEARKHGALGGKMTGAGGGGYMLFYCDFEKKHKVAEALCRLGATPTKLAFDNHGLQTWRAYEAGNGNWTPRQEVSPGISVAISGNTK